MGSCYNSTISTTTCISVHLCTLWLQTIPNSHSVESVEQPWDSPEEPWDSPEDPWDSPEDLWSAQPMMAAAAPVLQQRSRESPEDLHDNSWHQSHESQEQPWDKSDPHSVESVEHPWGPVPMKAAAAPMPQQRSRESPEDLHDNSWHQSHESQEQPWDKSDPHSVESVEQPWRPSPRLAAAAPAAVAPLPKTSRESPEQPQEDLQKKSQHQSVEKSSEHSPELVD